MRREMPALRLLVSLDGDDYEAFNTGRLARCATRWRVGYNLNYRTPHSYRGHRDVMKLLLHDLRLGERRVAPLSRSAIP